MPAKAAVAIPRVVEAFVKLVVGVILAAVFLALGCLAFEAIVGEELFKDLSGTGLGILAGGVVVGVSIVVGATMLSLKR